MYQFTDRDGYVWDKSCSLCNKYNPRGKGKNDRDPVGDATYCIALDKYIWEEPFKSYSSMGNNNCPYFHKS